MFESNSKAKWLNSSTLKAIKQKHKAWNTYKATHHHVDYLSYTTKRNITTGTVKRANPILNLSLLIVSNQIHPCSGNMLERM